MKSSRSILLKYMPVSQLTTDLDVTKYFVNKQNAENYFQDNECFGSSAVVQGQTKGFTKGIFLCRLN